MITTAHQLTVRVRRSRKGKLRHDVWMQDNEGRWYVLKKRWKLTEPPADEKKLGKKGRK